MTGWRNTAAGYGWPARALHWSTALLIFTNVALGLWSTFLALDTGPRDRVLDLHKSLGLLVIVLTVARLCWLAVTPGKLDRTRLAGWEVAAARTGHVLFYAVLLAMPLSGILMSQGSGREIGLFGIVHLPQLLPLDPAIPPRERPLYRAGKFLHDVVFQWSLYAIFAAHIAGVVKHRFVDGDRGFVRRMWGRPGAG